MNDFEAALALRVSESAVDPVWLCDECGKPCDYDAPYDIHTIHAANPIDVAVHDACCEGSPEKLEQHQRDVSDLADKFLDAAIARGESFSEGLCNWAISKAEREVKS